MDKIKAVILKRMKIMEKSAAQSKTMPNPWAHRLAELKLILEEIEKIERRGAA